jgi:hypothetical protein
MVLSVVFSIGRGFECRAVNPIAGGATLGHYVAHRLTSRDI